MAYEKQIWENYPSTNSPITADALNHIENGIYNNSMIVQDSLSGSSTSNSPSVRAINEALSEIQLRGGGDTLPIGTIMSYTSDTIPNGWLLCDGRAVSRAEYSELFQIIGTIYGTGDGSTTFNLPNQKGKVAVGKDSTDTDFNVLGKTGGEKEHTLTIDEMPSHTHEIKKASSVGGDGSGLAYSSTETTNSAGILNTGGSQPHNNLQPYIVTNFIIKAKTTIVTNGEVIQESGTPSNTNVYSSNAVLKKIKTNLITGQVTETKETIDGAKVYVKVIDIGTLPNATRKIVSTGLDENINVVDLRGIAKGSNLTIPLPFVYPELPSCISLMFVEGNIYINTGSDRTDLTGTVKIYYTINNNGANTGGAN